MKNFDNIVAKIKYDFLESTSNLFNDLVDSKCNIKNNIYLPTYLILYNNRGNEDCFYTMFCYFVETSKHLDFFARFIRDQERTSLHSYVSNLWSYYSNYKPYIKKDNEELFNKVSQLAATTLIDDINETTIYQYYDFESFLEKFPFYIKFNKKLLIHSIYNGDFF